MQALLYHRMKYFHVSEAFLLYYFFLMYSNNYQVLCIFMDFLNVLSPNYKAMIQPHHTKHSLSCQQVQYEDLYNSTTIYKRTLTILQNIKNEAYSLFLLPNEFSHQSHIIL